MRSTYNNCEEYAATINIENRIMVRLMAVFRRFCCIGGGGGGETDEGGESRENEREEARREG